MVNGKAEIYPPVERLEVVDSTNSEARRRIESGTLRAPLWLVADRQEKGRGRRGRDWQSPAGNFYGSLITLAPGHAAKAAQMSLTAAVAAAQAIDTISERRLHPECKWPNDLLVAGKKIAGILPEKVAAPDEQDWLIVGIGINVAHAPAPDKVRWPATSLNDMLADPVTLSQVLESLSLQFSHWMRIFDTEGFDPIAQAWSSRAALIGSRISLVGGGEKIRGHFLGIDEGGAARVRLDSGLERTVHGGELVFELPRE